MTITAQVLMGSSGVCQANEETLRVSHSIAINPLKDTVSSSCVILQHRENSQGA